MSSSLNFIMCIHSFISLEANRLLYTLQKYAILYSQLNGIDPGGQLTTKPLHYTRSHNASQAILYGNYNKLEQEF